LAAKRRQKAGRPIAFKVTSDEEVTTRAVGSVIVKRRSGKALRFRLKKLTLKIAADRPGTLRIGLKGRKAGRRLKRMARRSRSVTAAITVRCVDRAGNSTIRHLTLKLKS
jgi:hypothetical protein